MARSTEDQLAWEARAGRSVAIAAFVAAALAMVGNNYLAGALGGIPEDADEFLREAEREPGAFIVSGVLIALATLMVLPVLAYLFRAVRARRPELPPTALVLAVLGAVTYAVVAVVQAVQIVDLAKDFFPFQPEEGYEKITDPEEYADAVDPEAAADDARRDMLPPALGGAAIGGTLALAIAFVMTNVNAMRVGLLSRFMGVIGIIVGVTYVIPLGVQILPTFWLAALGFLFLGRWPGGRGPAWQTGEAIPWPGAGEQREEIERRRAEREAPPEPEPSPEPEPKPASRKRKKKRR